ncbi:MAG: hypothetical protein ACJ8IR_03865 [Alphaproteobacteria bacterium]|jgi:hypothetical protein
MFSKRHLAATVSSLAFAVVAAFSTSASAHHFTLHPKGPLGRVGPVQPPYHNAVKGKWVNLKNPFPGPTGPDTALLMTDGTVLMHSWCTSKWYRLTPDNKGRYVNGTWTTAGSLPTGYFPFFFASEVLPDGRMMINGGEYNFSDGDCGGGAWTAKGALYDNVSDTWTSVDPPTGWAKIGDAQSVVLPSLSYMVANCCTSQQAIATIKGTKVTWTGTGTGKADVNDEEGWTQLPNGKIITVDANKGLGQQFSLSELYDPSNGTWTTGPNTASALVDTGSHELGPGVLRPDGSVIWFGGTPNNNIYDYASNTFSAAPAFPIDGYDVADGPAVVLPNGNVLVEASPGVFLVPAHFFEWDGNAFTQVSDPKDAENDTSFQGRFLLLPTGQVFYSNDGQSPTKSVVAVYTPTGKPQEEWRPVIASLPRSISPGSTNNAISGTNFNGFTQGAYYGDDAQESTNFPIVMIKNHRTGHICFARSHDFSTMGVATVGTTTALFDVPANCETGQSVLRVSVNGISSIGRPIAVH